MNGRKAKMIRKLIKIKFPALYLMIRKYYGDETKNMDEKRIYRIAKKMWTKKLPGTEKWVYQKGEK
jgi:intein-encoded DNA endonuclease-like protein